MNLKGSSLHLYKQSTKQGKYNVYRDIIRISERHRKDINGNLIKEGSICKVIVQDRTVYAILRGLSEGEFLSPEIEIDERLRNQLKINADDYVDFLFKKSGFWGEFIWAWKASDPAYRISARMALLSVILGVLSLAVSSIFMKR